MVVVGVSVSGLPSGVEEEKNDCKQRGRANLATQPFSVKQIIGLIDV